MAPLQPGWPHSHAISAVSLWLSQWVLQYFLSVIQEQAGWAHFFRSAIDFYLLGKPGGAIQELGCELRDLHWLPQEFVCSGGAIAAINRAVARKE